MNILLNCLKLIRQSYYLLSHNDYKVDLAALLTESWKGLRHAGTAGSIPEFIVNICNITLNVVLCELNTVLYFYLDIVWKQTNSNL